MADIELSGVTRSFRSGAVAVDDLSLKIPSGAFLALLGPSGCGKTTALRLIAGLERPDAGEIFIGGARVAAPGLFVEPEDRGVGMVFQSYALWPHMSVLSNVEFGLKVRRMASAERRRRAMEALELVGLAAHAARRPHELSGGQRQRVALARSLAVGPAVILLDEPLANLDAHLREQMQAEFRRIHREAKTTFVFVTHDQSEAMALADHVAVMDAGRLQQVASPSTLFHRPASAMVARFIAGGRTVPVTVTGREADGSCRLDLNGRSLTLPGEAPVGPALLCLRTRDLAIVSAGDAPGAIPARVIDARFENGDHLLTVSIDGDGGPAEVKVRSTKPASPGESVWISIASGWVLADTQRHVNVAQAA
ncbi:ABC transporter ATP-binding protein [Aureimonas mangrovi]|uniref:ABC transporter ATP-binding protein n=1 Tax=Aureimonas mangrovi TaxID=2758041 RepID=UPI00163D69FF|nr:ABC transporter ATP-binding protein [Aureimonas mangrovi]